MNKTTKNRLFIGVFLAGLIILCYYTRSIVKPVAFSMFIAYLLNPIVKLAVLKGVNKKIAALLSILMTLGLFVFAVIYIIPGVTRDTLGILMNIDSYSSEIENIIYKIRYDKLPIYLKNVIDTGILGFQSSITKALNEFLKSLVDFTMQLPTYALSPVFIYYFLVDSDYFIDIVKSLIPASMRNKTVELGHQIDSIIGSFIKSQLILSAIVTFLTFIALLIMKIKYPLIIAVANGIANIIPYFGPVIGLLPAFLSGFTESLSKAIIVTVVFFVIQELESMIIAPKLMGENLGIHPVFIMIVLLLGGKFFGGWGLILAVPAAGILNVTYKYVINNLF